MYRLGGNLLSSGWPEYWREGDGVGSGTQPASRRSICAEDGRVPGSVGCPVRMKPPASARKAPLRVSGKPSCSMPSLCGWMCNAGRECRPTSCLPLRDGIGRDGAGRLKTAGQVPRAHNQPLVPALLAQAGYGYRVNEEQRTSLGMCRARS